jgi:phosphoglycolate phosphatase-like HAD superfamily hydrolase
MPNLFVWDFHGTLERDNDKVVHIVCNRVLQEQGITRPVSMEEVVALYGVPWAGYFRHLTDSKDENYIQQLCTRATELSRKISPMYTKPADGAEELLASLKRAGHTNIVLSNTTPDRLLEFVQLVGLIGYIDDCISSEGDKAAKLKKWLDGKRFDRIFVIGDREPDIEAGLAVGATTILVTKDSRPSRAHHRVQSLLQIPRLLK